MSRLAIAVAVFLASPALAGSPGGIWRTEANDEGNYLHVEITPCRTDAALWCGTIVSARNSAGKPIASAHIGRQMIAGMKPDGPDAWSGGTIWAPDDDETYSSNMRLKGNLLSVEGCVFGGLICRGQDWRRVK
ncbi:MAG: DUF2147 domain-containing protein [Alphaproteobacteria bacterium]|nr:MAG: DUF2147 domain-containing protein [Alphaproteobacteria bacterium]